MNSKVIFTIFALFVLYLPSTQGMSIIMQTDELRCMCINYVSNFIPLNKMKDIDIFPKGPHCSNVEVIATLKNGKKICLLAEASWVKKMINIILNNI
ncbi:interleukin-8-like [Narcine bancroftii]|uniref:interleukin-8-like n=1 Tax=Narcine bancroftii TaxID=1343680 RepID=UPI003831FE1B